LKALGFSSRAGFIDVVWKVMKVVKVMKIEGERMEEVI
jgi:hypothetical protein